MRGLLVLALLAGAEASYDELVVRGLALGREGRHAEARAAFDAAVALDPGRPEARVERGGLSFLEKRYDDATQELRAALRLREDAYVRDLLAASLHLAGREDEALACWNAMGRPVLGSLEIQGLARMRDVVARREIWLREGEVVRLADVRETRLRLRETRAFDRVSVRSLPRGEGRADVEVGLVERHGFFRSWPGAVTALGVDALQDRVRLRYSDVGGEGIGVGALYRWGHNRPEAALVLDWPRPLGLDANLRVRGVRGRQRYDVDGTTRIDCRGVDVALRRVLGARAVGELAWRARDRTLPTPRPDARPGLVSGFELALERRMIEDRRLRLDASVRVLGAAPALGSDLGFSRVLATAEYQVYLTPPEGTALEPSVLAVRALHGQGSAGLPLDHWFAPGASPDMEYPLRGHRQARDGILGGTPLGRSLTQWNVEWRRRVVRATVQAGLVLFYDAARIGRGVGGATTLHDAGLGLRLAFPGASVLRVDYAHGLSDGRNVVSVGLGQVF